MPRVRLPGPLLASIIAFVAAGCTTDPPTTPPGPTTYTLSPAAQWSGGVVFLHAASIAGSPGSHLVWAGDDSIVPTAVDDSTVSFPLPLGPSGAVAIRVSGAAGGDSVGMVQRVGWAGTRDLQGVYWGLTAWRPHGTFAVLGYGHAPPYDLFSADLLTGAATEFSGLGPPGESSWAVSTGLMPGSVVARGSAPDSIAVWQLAPSVIRIGEAVNEPGGVRQLVQISDSLFVATGHHSYSVLRLGDANFARSGQLEETQRVVSSPDGNWTTFAATTSPFVDPYGVPVLDSHNGDSLYVLPLRSVAAVAFSADSRTLYAAGGDISGTTDTLIAMDPATGAVTLRTAVPDSARIFAIIEEPQTGRLYLGAELNPPTGPSEVLVYDAGTLELLGRLPGGLVCVSYCSVGDLSVDPSTHRLFVAAVGQTPTVQTFDLLP